MLPLAHMGIGSKLVTPWARQLPKGAFLVGTVLPDAIDKPLFYFMLFYARIAHTTQGFLNNSRTIAHTGLFLLALTTLAVVRRSRLLAAIALGVATHLMLDNLNDTLVDYFLPEIGHPPEHSALVALLFPFFQPYFPVARFNSLAAHAHRSINSLSLGFELVGGAILLWDYWQKRHESEILAVFTRRRGIRK